MALFSGTQNKSVLFLKDTDDSGYLPFTATAATDDTITKTSHGLIAGDVVTFSSTGTLPVGLSAAIAYYVVSPGTNNFKVSTSSGGSAVDITSAGSGTLSVTKMKTKPVVLGATLLSSIDKVLIADKNTGYVISMKSPLDVSVQDLTNDVSATNIRAFGLDSSGLVICGIIFIQSASLGARDSKIFTEGVIELHTKTSTSPSVSYS